MSSKTKTKKYSVMIFLCHLFLQWPQPSLRSFNWVYSVCFHDISVLTSLLSSDCCIAWLEEILYGHTVSLKQLCMAIWNFCVSLRYIKRPGYVTNIRMSFYNYSDNVYQFLLRNVKINNKWLQISIIIRETIKWSYTFSILCHRNAYKIFMNISLEYK